MKRLISMFLIVALCFCFPACSQEAAKIQTPVNFYFRRAELTFGGDTGVICAQQAESEGHEDDLSWLLRSYFETVPDEGLTSPFPIGTTLISITIDERNADVILSDILGLKQGMDLTIACACITMTVLDLTDVETVTIRTHGAKLGGAEQIVMDRSCLLLIDNSAEEEVEE